MASTTASPEQDQAQQSLVEQFRAEATKRRDELNAELEPKLAELRDLQSALDALNHPSNDGEQPDETPRRRQRRRRKGGTRGDEFVKIVGENPGITVTEIAEKMGLDKPNYLYRVAEQMVQDKRVKKEGTGYLPSGK